MEEFSQTIYAVAKDAYIEIRFDPELVKSYRLIGFDNKLTALQDSTNEIQGGEIGSGHSLMAIVEIEPVELETELAIRTNPFGKLWMHYQLPGQDVNKLEEFAIPYYFMPFEICPTIIDFLHLLHFW
jgi:Ca-activated chloride channel family protein